MTKCAYCEYEKLTFCFNAMERVKHFFQISLKYFLSTKYMTSRLNFSNIDAIYDILMMNYIYLQLLVNRFL